MLAIALNFCLLYAIGLGAVDAAVRLRNCDCALASRIGALALTLNIHLFTSRRAGSSPRPMHDKGHIPLGRKADKGRFRLRSVSETSTANGVDDTTVNESACLIVFETSGVPFQKEIKARSVEDSTFLE